MGIAAQLEGVVRQYVTTGTPQPTPTPTAPNTGLPDDEYVRAGDLNRVAPKLIDDRLQPQLQPVFESIAAMNLEAVKREFPDYFAKYGPSIYGNLAHVDKKAWNVDNLRKVVKLSVVDHLDDIVRDRLHNAPPMEPALRSTGAAPAPVTSAPADDFTLRSDKLDPEYKAKLEKAGVTEATLDEFLRGAGMTRESFFKMASKRQVITEAPRT